MKLVGKTILITGANRGIGLALVQEALKLGAAKVYATYRSEENRSVFDALDSRVVPIQLDLSDDTSIAGLAERVKTLDVLVNNAGVFSAADVLADTGKELRADIQTNVFGTLAVTKALLETLQRSEKAALANVSSIAALAAMPNLGGYSASKAAVHSITQSIRGKLADTQISVHGIYPGPVATRQTEGFDLETTPAPVVAQTILRGIENGDDYIFPDAMSEQVGPLYLSAPQQLEQTFAAF